jgi:anti-sigma factor RsiW
MAALHQAALDGEADALAMLRYERHVAGCPACAEEKRRLEALRAAVRTGATYHAAPEALRRRLQGALRATRGDDPPVPSPAGTSPQLRPRAPWRARLVGPWPVAAALLLGLAIGAGGAGIWAGRAPDRDDTVEALLTSHARALQPGHLIDVASSDHHTVKPWFAGKLSFSPPVKDLAAAGFPLAGGRLDVLGGQTVAVVVYRHGGHSIDLYVRPAAGAPDQAPRALSRDGFNMVGWQEGGFALWAVSDMNEAELAAFVGTWRQEAG